MTKLKALDLFKSEILPALYERYGYNDRPAVTEAWNNFTDWLQKNGKISAKQYHSWSNPF